MTSSIPSAPWSLTYHDGSGNGYRFWQDADQDEARFSYSPITPETSSSGTYSGGSPNSGTLTEQQAADLWQAAEYLEARASPAVPRTMGSGSFRLKTAAGTRSFRIPRGSTLFAFDKQVAPFRGS
jgi:hypothetical protein